VWRAGILRAVTLVLVAVISIARDTEDVATALLYPRELARMSPADVQVRATVLDFEKRQGRP
jgi:hypothetical protein